MIEVFKTNVTGRQQASRIIDVLHKKFKDYKANFDLEDCDNILRVECANGVVEPSCIVDLLTNCGFHAEVLTDEVTLVQP